MAPRSPDDDGREGEGAERGSDKILQRSLDEAACCYRQRCEPLPPPPDENAEIIWMVGLPAAGKTTTADRLPGRRRIGIDDVREELGLAFDDPGWVTDAYEVVIERLRDAVEEREAVVFDSTGLNLLARQQVLSLGDAEACPVRALWVDEPINFCRRRQSVKGRKRYNPFFDHCVGLLLRALRHDLLLEAFASYHVRRGDPEPATDAACSTKE